jgi:hypothetical protein
VANGGPDQNVAPLDQVTLDGRGSRDPGNCPDLTYAWSILSAPPESALILPDPTQAVQRFQIDVAGTYVFALSVTNGLGRTDPTPDRVRVVARPIDGLYVQLTWDDDADLDLHLMEEGARLFDTPGDACYCNMTPDWGLLGNSVDDPSLDIDDVDGLGPETITLTRPQDGRYRVAVHYYRGEGRPNRPTRARVRIFTRDRVLATFNADLTRPEQEVWTVAEIEFPSLQVFPIDQRSSTNRNSCR